MPARRAQSDSTATEVSRRRALKLAAGVGAGTIVWSEPTIKGLARTPAYANAGSSTVAFTLSDLTTDLPVALSLAGPVVTTLAGITLFLTGGGLGGPTISVTKDGCSCDNMVVSGNLVLRTSNDVDPDVVLPFASVAGSVLTFAGALGPGTVTLQTAPGGGAASITGSCATP